MVAILLVILPVYQYIPLLDVSHTIEKAGHPLKYICIFNVEI